MRNYSVSTRSVSIWCNSGYLRFRDMGLWAVSTKQWEDVPVAASWPVSFIRISYRYDIRTPVYWVKIGWIVTTSSYLAETKYLQLTSVTGIMIPISSMAL